MGNLVFAYNVVGNGKDVAEREIKAREVYGNRDRGFAAGNAVADSCTDLPDYGRIEQVDNAFFFKHVNELVRIYHAEFRVFPPRKSLKTA